MGGSTKTVALAYKIVRSFGFIGVTLAPMAIFHIATNTPPKPELVAAWVRDQPWGPATDETVEVLGTFHLDDPEGEVGMQVYLIQAGETILQVPLTYRDTPLRGNDEALVGTLTHSVLGTRYVYDGLSDDRFVSVLAGVSACGYGQALGFAQHDGRWFAWPDQLVLQHLGSISGRVPVDRFVVEPTDDIDSVLLRNERLDLVVYRRPRVRTVAEAGLTTTWQGHSEPVTLVEIRER